MLARQLHPHAHAHGVGQLAAELRVRAREVDVLEHAHRRPRFRGAEREGRGQPARVQPHHLARFHLAHELRPQLVERAALGREHVAAVQPADAERANAVRVAHPEDGVAREHGQRIGAVGAPHERAEALLPALAGRVGDEPRDHFGVGRGLELHPLRDQVGAQQVCVDDVAVVGERQFDAGPLHPQRLAVGVHARSGGGVARVPDGGRARQSGQHLFLEDLDHEPHLRVEVQALAVAGGDPGRFLAAVLKGVQCEESEPGYVFTRRVNAEDAALLAQVRAQ